MADQDGKTLRPLTGRVGRLRALRELGWIAVLRRSEFQLLTAYDSYADGDGVSFPSNEKLRKDLGLKSDKNIPRYRQYLITRGLLRIVEQGGGRSKPCVVQMIIPEIGPVEKSKSKSAENPVECLVDKPPLNPLMGEGVSEIKPPQIVDETPSDRGAKPPQIAESLNKEEVTNEHTKNRPLAGRAEKSAKAACLMGLGATHRPDNEAAIFEQIEGWEISGLPHDSADFRLAVAKNAAHLREMGKMPGAISWRERIAALGRMKVHEAIEALDHSTANGYTGLVRPNGNGAKNGNSKHKPTAEQRGEYGRPVTIRNRY